MVTIPNRRSRLLLLGFIIILFCLAVFIRFAYLKHTEVEETIRGDAYQYYAYAYNLRYFGIHSLNTKLTPPPPDSYRAPGYPLFIAILIFFMGDTEFYPLILYVQAILSSLLVILTFILGLKLLPRWAAVMASIGVAFSPHLISIQGYILSETLFTFFLLLCITCFQEALNKQEMSYFVTAALLFGITYLINETVLLLPPLLAAISFFIFRMTSRSEKRHLNVRPFFVFLLVFALIPCWWLYRSSQLPDDVLKSNARAIKTLSHGAYPGFIYKDPRYKNYPYREDPQQPEFSQSFSNFTRILWERFKQRPIRYLSWYILEKPYYLWSWDNLQSQRGTAVHKGRGDVYFYPVKTSLYMTSKLANASRQIMKYLHPVVLLLAVFCVPLVYIHCRSSKRDKDIISTPVFLLAMGLYYTLVYTIFAPWPRYSVPLRPQLYICAIWSVVYIGKRLLPDAKSIDPVRDAKVEM